MSSNLITCLSTERGILERAMGEERTAIRGRIVQSRRAASSGLSGVILQGGG